MHCFSFRIKLKRMSRLVLEKSLEFAVMVVTASQQIAAEKHEYVLSKQLVRSGTAITALVHEAQYAESRRDFIHKMSIALKEANETKCWLKILRRSNLYHDPKLFSEVESLLKILTAIVKTSKQNLNQKVNRESE